MWIFPYSWCCKQDCLSRIFYIVALVKVVVPGVNTTMRSCRALSSSRWKVWFNVRAEPRRVSRAVLALIAPSIWITKKISLLPSDLRRERSTRVGRENMYSESDYKDVNRKFCLHITIILKENWYHPHFTSSSPTSLSINIQYNISINVWC